jgi:Flp pilus assembly protein TadD
MTGWELDDRAICAALMAAAGLLLVLRLRPRAARAAWAALLLAGIANALVISLQPANLVNINLVHHYLGAKYPIPYDAFYEAVNAAREAPQAGMRDLDHPTRIVRGDPREERAYFIDLMRKAGVTFEPLAPLDDLGKRAREFGAIRADADRILGELLSPSRVEDFRADVRLALGRLGWNRDITTDYGFNGSPFYALIRQVDPTLHRPFGTAVAAVNLVWQALAVFLLAWLVGRALELPLESRLAVAALVFASWDFVGYALPGLIFGGLWIPVALAVLWMRRRPAWAGAAMGWAGLVKLFPFILVLPASIRLVRSILRRRTDCVPWATRLLAAGGLTVLLLGATATLTGRSWAGFVHKIDAQFDSAIYLLNSVSLGQGLLTLGIHDSPVTIVLSLVALAVLAGMFLRGDDDRFMAALPRRSLVLLASVGWLTRTWFDYYAIAPLLLLPALAPRHRYGAAAVAWTLAAVFVLPAFDDPILVAHPVLHFAKVAPYLIVPAWMVGLEYREPALGRLGRRVAVVAASVLVVLTAGEAWRGRTIVRMDAEGGAALDRGDYRLALERYGRLVTLSPRNGLARMNRAIALAGLGRRNEAGREFARAVTLAPGDAGARQNYARWLMGEGRGDEAMREIEEARKLAPCDETILYDEARLELGQGDKARAIALLIRARELNPGNRAVRALLANLVPR